MVPFEDNELMCRVGAGTPMGEAMRRFWAPACLSAELPEPDGDPIHIELLGESLVAFRDSNGTVGLLDEYCCHRGASLTIGRVENCGVRCLYHGWLFGVDGTVLETPNVADPQFKERFKAKAYPVREAGGFVWAYLGAGDKPPPFPDFPWLNSEPEARLATLQVNGCNYVQMLEGLLDSSHLTLLHSTSLKRAAGGEINFAKATSHMKFDAAPRVESEETEFGVHYAAIRVLDGKAETRVTALVAPFWVLNPNGDIFVGCVPMTDTKTAFYTLSWDGKKPYGQDPLRTQQLTMIGFDQETLEAYGQTRATFDGPGRMRRENGFRQDRALMRAGHFTGVPALALEDSLVCVSAGPLRDRSKERLSTADLAIAHLYRYLIKSAKRVRDGGKPLGYGVSLAHVVGTNARLEPGEDWRKLVPGHYKVRPLVAAG
jgi:phthalate 4,5-dioxygenase